VVVDAGQLDDLLKRLALDSLAPTCASGTAETSPSSEREPEVPLLGWRWHVAAIIGMGVFLGVVLGLAAAMRSRAPRDEQGSRAHEMTAAPRHEPDPGSAAATGSGPGPGTGPGPASSELSSQAAREPVRAPVQVPGRRGPRAPMPSAWQGSAPRAILSAPRDEGRNGVDAGRDDGEYIREL